ncbi:hypothetical protein [Halalkalicoccus tibetensis]|uniref:Uncharacterized protein n=1 Tax=Halalkalicoccus tibetensis TaxID=175632 RepID=A0ABD5V9E5_9EURY
MKGNFGRKIVETYTIIGVGGIGELYRSSVIGDFMNEGNILINECHLISHEYLTADSSALES